MISKYSDLNLLAMKVQYLSKSPRAKFQNMKPHSWHFTVCCASWLRNSYGNAKLKSCQLQLWRVRKDVQWASMQHMGVHLPRVQIWIFRWPKADECRLDIVSKMQNQVVRNANKTGWRVQGKTYWLRCLATKIAAYYLIDPKRGGSVLKRLYCLFFNGVLVTVFWGA